MSKLDQTKLEESLLYPLRPLDSKHVIQPIQNEYGIEYVKLYAELKVLAGSLSAFRRNLNQNRRELNNLENQITLESKRVDYNIRSYLVYREEYYKKKTSFYELLGWNYP